MMRTVKTQNESLWVSFLADESGATAIEYALICGLIAIGIIGGLRAMGTSINGVFGTATTELTTALE